MVKAEDAPPSRSIAERELAALGGLALVPAVRAQAAYPDRPVRVIIPNAPGSSVDTIGRLACNEMTRALPQPLVIDNRAGAAGALGVERARNAPPDGTTLLVGSSCAIAVAPLLQRAVTYQPLRDFDLISLLAMQTSVLVCNPRLPVQDVTQLVAYAKSRGSRPASRRRASARNPADGGILRLPDLTQEPPHDPRQQPTHRA